MQKLCALLLLTISAWLLVAPFAGAPAEQSLLPACCRRAGAHHCAAGSAALQGSDRRASLRNAGCLLMPRHSVAAVQRLASPLSLLLLSFLACWSPFLSTSAIESYARALALKSPRGPPCFSFA